MQKANLLECKQESYRLTLVSYVTDPAQLKHSFMEGVWHATIAIEMLSIILAFIIYIHSHA